MPPLPELKKQIHDNAYATVPFPVSKDEFREAMKVFFAFLALPLEVKQPIHFRVNPDNRGTEVGYQRYRREEGKTDNREYVHYHRLAEERLGEARARIPELDNLLYVMKGIHDKAVNTIDVLMREFDTAYPGSRESFFSKEAPGNFYLRFLKYDIDKPGEFLAKGHYDRGTCSLALAESNPGLRMGTSPEDIQEVIHKEGEALFFPSLTFSEITSAEFVPTWHDVIQKETDAYSADVARWAVVLFADSNELPHITYEEAHSPRVQS